MPSHLREAAALLLLPFLGFIPAVAEPQDHSQCSGGSDDVQATASSAEQRALMQHRVSVRANVTVLAHANSSVQSNVSVSSSSDTAANASANWTQEPGGENMDTLHYTMHGCLCQSKWEWNGESFQGCSGNGEEPFAKGHVWCPTDKACVTPAGKLPNNKGKWDYCSSDADVVHTRTLHGCHCNPIWEWDDRVYESCGKTSKGPKWCYVFESDQMCPQAMRTEHGGQHWDYCFTEDQASPYLTRQGCHCMPEYEIEGVKYKGCDTIKINGKEMQGCLTLEDGEGLSCHAPLEVPNSFFLADECFITEDNKKEVVPTLVEALSPDCHCQPIWQHKGKEYRDCSSTPDRERGWCYIVEDYRLCEEADGINDFEGGDGQRWRYCVALPEGATEEEEGKGEGEGEGEKEEEEEEKPERKEREEKPEGEEKKEGGEGEGEEKEGKEVEGGKDKRYVQIVPVVVPYPVDAYQPQSPTADLAEKGGEESEEGGEGKEEKEEGMEGKTVEEELAEKKEKEKNHAGRSIAKASILIVPALAWLKLDLPALLQ